MGPNSMLTKFDFDRNQGLYHIPVAFVMLTSVHHLLLVANSSVNFIIYCCVGRDFRAHVCRWFCNSGGGGSSGGGNNNGSRVHNNNINSNA